MRILFVINHAGYFLTHRLPLALEARGRGWDVHVATPRSRHVPEIEAAGLEWHEVPLRRSGTNPIEELRTLFALRRLYRSLRPDLVHQVTQKPVLYGTLAARLAGTPAVVNAVAGLGHLHIARGIRYRALRFAVGVGYRFALRHPRMRVIFQNPDDMALFVDHGWLSPGDAAIVPGSGVDLEAFSPEGHRASGERLTVLFPSRMLRTKGLVELVGAARLLKSRGRPARVLLVGDPDPDNPASVAESEILKWVDEGLVEYVGRQKEMPGWYRQADIVCLPSYREGLPKTLVEAAAMALPAVTTDVPGCRDVVRDGETGFLVPVRTVEPLADGIERLALDEDLRRKMGRRARERAEREFSLERVLELTFAIYEELA